ncbi:hypothetical protein HK101_008755 [Irineochytrium annulatum]|nr:hypothetical protein HK101_008755 [Irineochytrium annulatum]
MPLPRRARLFGLLVVAVITYLAYFILTTDDHPQVDDASWARKRKLMDAEVRHDGFLVLPRRQKVPIRAPSVRPDDALDDLRHLPAMPVSKFVDGFVGTDGEGHVWAGASRPHGMVKVGVDSDKTPQGYHSTREVFGISHVHASGIGGGRSYQNMGLFPLLIDAGLDPMAPRNPSVWSMSTNRTNEGMAVGYYTAALSRFNVTVEFAAANRAAIHRWTFNPKLALVDHQSRSKQKVDFLKLHAVFHVQHDASNLLEGSVRVLPGGLRVVASGLFKESWSGGLNGPTPFHDQGHYKVHLCAEPSLRPDRYGVWGTGFFPYSKTSSGWNGKELTASSFQGSATLKGMPLGSFLTYDIDPTVDDEVEVEVRVGVSFLSVAKACDNLAEVAPTSTFEAVREGAVDAWEDVLSSIMVEGPVIGGVGDYTIFYSSLYRVFLMPTNRTGENPLWEGKVHENKPYFDDYYCLWDTFRTLHPLLSLLAPCRQSAMVNSLITSAVTSRFKALGDCFIGNHWGITQVGNSAEVVVADAYVKGLKDINWDFALDLMIEGAEKRAVDSLYAGRGNVEQWRDYGYVPMQTEKSTGDFSLYQVARGLGRFEEARKYLKRSGNWKNLWKADAVGSERNITGFIVPKDLNGQFATGLWADTDTCEFYEDGTWAYSLFVPQNVQGVIKASGGDEKFIRRLDAFFELKPDKSISRINEILAGNFSTARDGIPGNDDSASMASFYIWAAVGLYPVAGQDVYLISAPRFKRSTFRLGVKGEDDNGGSTKIPRFTTIAHDLSVARRQILRVELNGVEMRRSWLKHTEISGEGILEMWMGEKWEGWGSEVKTRPPSFAEDGAVP